MAIKGRVGRHARSGGRHCQNWIDDQKRIIDLLNRVAVSDGGAGGKLAPARLVNGLAGEPLYAAILRFEDRHAPGRRTGFIDPGGPLMKRLEALAARAATSPAAHVSETRQPVEEAPLDALRVNILDDSRWRGVAATKLAELDPWVKRAAKHVDDLKEQGFVRLAWNVELLGRVHLTKGLTPYRAVDSGTVQFVDDATGKDESPRLLRHSVIDRPASRPLPEMAYFRPVDETLNITTAHLGALLLFNESYGNVCARIMPYHHGRVSEIGKYLQANRDWSLLPARPFSGDEIFKRSNAEIEQLKQVTKDLEQVRKDAERKTQELKTR